MADIEERRIRRVPTITSARQVCRCLAAIGLLTHLGAPLPVAQAPPVNALAARVDAYVEKQRVIVMTDIANEPEDQMSMVRFLVYSNHFDVEGLIATTSTWMRTRSGRTRSSR